MIRKLPSGGYRLYSRKINPKTGMRDNHMLAMIDKKTGDFLGHVCLERMHYIPGNNYEINFFVDPVHQNKGYGREAVINMMHYGFDTLGLYAYTVTIDPKNGHILQDKQALQFWSRDYEKGWEPQV